MIQWGEAFATGSAALDQQHRILIENINGLEEQLHTTNPTREDLAFVIKLVDYLAFYANAHFQDEEHCMLKSKCPAFAVNQKAHERFREFIREFKRQCDLKGFNVELLRQLHELLEAWVQEHLLKIDTQLRSSLRAAPES